MREKNFTTKRPQKTPSHFQSISQCYAPPMEDAAHDWLGSRHKAHCHQSPLGPYCWTHPSQLTGQLTRWRYVVEFSELWKACSRMRATVRAKDREITQLRTTAAAAENRAARATENKAAAEKLAATAERRAASAEKHRRCYLKQVQASMDGRLSIIPDGLRIDGTRETKEGKVQYHIVAPPVAS